MKKHNWKRGQKVYDALWECSCASCGVKTVVYLDEDVPSNEAMVEDGIPLDCDEGFVFVIMNS